MAEHPTLDELQEFLRGRLPAAANRAVVAHLIRRCPVCLAAMPAELDLLLGNLPAEPVEDPGYDEVLDRAFAAQRWHGPAAMETRQQARRALAAVESGGVEELAEAPQELKGVGACEALLERSWELRHEDPEQMLELANYATLLADRLGPAEGTPRQLADLRCRAWAALGNAYRVADDLDAAEWALGRAAELYLDGTGDEDLAARFLDLQASLCGARRQFRAALEALGAVHALHRRRGDDHLAGRALISKGLYSGYANDPEGAVRLLSEGLELIDPERDPKLTLAAVHNIA